MSNTSPVLEVHRLGAPWHTFDPFLFCMHHRDDYPKGNEQMGPSALLSGRSLGQDFAGKDGWSMYHGRVVPGFPQHPHRGFETVTLARKGLIDHADSLGATARFGRGDVQWMTAGKGISHSEMFPLVERDRENPAELFQVWLNLPASDKLVDPYFTMLWADTIPRISVPDAQGRHAHITMVAGAIGDARVPPPPPNSWAARKEAEVAIWTIHLEPGARYTLPTASPGVNRALYLFRGNARIGDRDLTAGFGAKVRPDVPVELVNGPEEAELLMLQGRPIGEPVAHYGPFVMNTRAELEQAFAEYRSTRFGGWPWPADDPVHKREEGRFAIHADGRKEKPVG